jgi:hypothetical protein
MKRLALAVLAVAFLGFTACSSDDGGTNVGPKKDTASEAVDEEVIFGHDDVSGGNDATTDNDTSVTPFETITGNDTTGNETTHTETITNPEGTQTETINPTETSETTGFEIILPDTTQQETVADEHSCKWVYTECFAACPKDAQGYIDQQCGQQCLQQASPQGLQDYNALSSCIQSKCSTATTDAEFSECLNTFCMDQYYACFHGDQPCSALLQCQDADCVAEGTVDAQKQFWAILDCLRAACCTTETCDTPTENQCWSTQQQQGGSCYDELQACAGPQQWGTATCAETVTCMNNCPQTAEGEQCAMDCMQQISEAGYAKLQAIYTCIEEQCCPTDPAQCSSANPNYESCFTTAQSGACQSTLQACMTDTGFMSGSQVPAWLKYHVAKPGAQTTPSQRNLNKPHCGL